jgi:hypothetical protein
LLLHIEKIREEIIDMDLSNYENSIYILNVISTKDSKNYKIIKQ